MVAEIRWLRKDGRKARANAIVKFLRPRDWTAMDGFKFDDKVVALMARVVALLYPDTEEMLTFRHCEADEILGTHLVHRGSGTGSLSKRAHAR